MLYIDGMRSTQTLVEIYNRGRQNGVVGRRENRKKERKKERKKFDQIWTSAHLLNWAEEGKFKKIDSFTYEELYFWFI